MKWFIFSVFFCLQGCSINYFFYSPDDKIGYTKNDFNHPVSDTFIRSHSGNTLHLQHHTSEQDLGLVVHFHGNRGNLSQTVDKVVWLVKEGYDVLLVDYSGYGLSTGDPSRETLALDAQTVLELTAALDYDHKVIIATSMGGAIALDGLERSGEAEAFNVMVIDSSFESYQNLAKDVVAKMPIANWFSDNIPAVVSDERAPMENIKSLNSLSKLITHCEEDKLIPISRSHALFDAAQGNALFWQFQHCGHARTFTDEFPLHQQKLVTFLKADRDKQLTNRQSQIAALK